MKAYKVELLIIDFDQIGEEEIRYQIEDTKYSNHCISPQVKNIEALKNEISENGATTIP